MWFFSFGSVYVVDYVYRLAYVEPALHSQDEAYLIMMVVCISVGLVVTAPLSFFIASIQFFSLFFFISLASGLFC